SENTDKTIALPDRSLLFSTTFPADYKSAATILNNVSLSSYGLNFTAKSLSFGDTLAIESGSASVDLSGTKLFTGIEAQGQIVASNVTGEIPLKGDAAAGISHIAG